MYHSVEQQVYPFFEIVRMSSTSQWEYITVKLCDDIVNLKIDENIIKMRLLEKLKSQAHKKQ